MEGFVYAPPNAPLDILHKDDALLVVNKPSGLLSVPGKAAEHADCLETRVKTYDPEALLVHRLDMDTSGVMVFARSKPAQRHLGLQFEKRYIRKTYEALVHGEVTEDAGRIDLPLRVDWPNRPLQMVCFDHGKTAVTNWRVIDRGTERSRVELNPITGRSHQLRVHLLEIGHPILGDCFYGPDDKAPRLMLHAKMLQLHHPKDGELKSFTARVPF